MYFDPCPYPFPFTIFQNSRFQIAGSEVRGVLSTSGYTGKKEKPSSAGLSTWARGDVASRAYLLNNAAIVRWFQRLIWTFALSGNHGKEL